MKREILFCISICLVLFIASCGLETGKGSEEIALDSSGTQASIVRQADSSASFISDERAASLESSPQDSQKKQLNRHEIEASKKRVFLEPTPGRELSKPPANPQWADSVYQENLRKKHIRDSIKNAGQ